jgi:hypothetical protein
MSGRLAGGPFNPAGYSAKRNEPLPPSLGDRCHSSPFLLRLVPADRQSTLARQDVEANPAIRG